MAQYDDPGHIKGPVFIPNCLQVRLIWRLANQKEANNVLHFSYAADPPRTQTFANQIYSLVQTALTGSGHINSLAQVMSFQAVALRDMQPTNPPGGYAEIRSNLAALAGGTDTDPLPANVSFVVSLRTERRGQANRGRVYLTGFHEDTNDASGVPTDDAKNAAVDFIGRIDTAMQALGYHLGIGHAARAAYDSPVPPFTHHDARAPGVVDVISITAIDQVWDSTRLRNKL